MSPRLRITLNWSPSFRLRPRPRSSRCAIPKSVARMPELQNLSFRFRHFFLEAIYTQSLLVVLIIIQNKIFFSIDFLYNSLSTHNTSIAWFSIYRIPTTPRQFKNIIKIIFF